MEISGNLSVEEILFTQVLNTDDGGDVGGFGEPLRIKQQRHAYYCSAASISSGDFSGLNCT